MHVQEDNESALNLAIYLWMSERGQNNSFHTSKAVNINKKRLQCILCEATSIKLK